MPRHVLRENPIGNVARLLPSLEVGAVSQATSPGSNPNPLYPLRARPYATRSTMHDRSDTPPRCRSLRTRLCKVSFLTEPIRLPLVSAPCMPHLHSRTGLRALLHVLAIELPWLSVYAAGSHVGATPMARYRPSLPLDSGEQAWPSRPSKSGQTVATFGQLSA